MYKGKREKPPLEHIYLILNLLTLSTSICSKVKPWYLLISTLELDPQIKSTIAWTMALTRIHTSGRFYRAFIEKHHNRHYEVTGCRGSIRKNFFPNQLNHLTVYTFISLCIFTTLVSWRGAEKGSC